MFKFSKAADKAPSTSKSKPQPKPLPKSTRALALDAAKKIKGKPNPHVPPSKPKTKAPVQVPDQVQVPPRPEHDAPAPDVPLGPVGGLGEVAQEAVQRSSIPPEPKPDFDPEIEAPIQDHTQVQAPVQTQLELPFPPAAETPLTLSPPLTPAIPLGGPTAISFPAAEPYDVRLLAPHLRLLNSGPTVALADMLENSANAGTPFALLCAESGVDVLVVADMMEKLGVGMAKLQSSHLLSPVLQDVALDSRSVVVMCGPCAGTGKIDPLKHNIPSTLAEVPCPDCGGVGSIRRPGDKQARMLLFKSLGVVSGGGIHINNQVGVGVSIEGRQAKIVSAAQTLLRVGRDARLASEPETAGGANVIDPDELVTYTDVVDVDSGGGA